jgi:hypothetical protein
LTASGGPNKIFFYYESDMMKDVYPGIENSCILDKPQNIFMINQQVLQGFM